MKKVVVAIDFGTSGTTYAFAFSHQKENIITGKWNINQEKNPTEIILDDTLKIIKFGNECKDYLGEQSSSENTFYYYKDIKMELYKNKKEILADNGSVKLPLAIVISKILIKIKEKALKDIKAREPLISENDIEWKVTVPAIWKNESKDIMKKACQSAGIFNKEQESTFFALEPEAAACDYLMNHPSEKAIVPGTTYIVLDIGGGTVDISTHKRIEENGEIYIEEAYPPIGGDNGSTYINKKFIEEVIQNLFGQDAMNTLLERVKNPLNKKDIYDDYCDFLEAIEEFKINISEEKENESRRINCSIFSKFIGENHNIDDLIEKYNQNCNEKWKITKNNGFKLYFPYKIMIDLTNEIIIGKVVMYINQIIKEVPYINSIIYAGSVSSNHYVYSMIKKKFNYIDNLNHYLCTYPSLAVVKGAVIFGLNPYIIKKRISKYTIGISCNDIWNEIKHGNHPEKKYFDLEDNCYRCKDVFSPIIMRNQKIKVDDIKSQHYQIKSNKSSIQFYKTIYNGITFVDERDIFSSKCQKFGELIFDIGDKYDKNDKNLIIELKLGGTFISSSIKYKNKEEKANFDFN